VTAFSGAEAFGHRKLKSGSKFCADAAGASERGDAAKIGVGGSRVYRTSGVCIGNWKPHLREPRTGASPVNCRKEEALLIGRLSSPPRAAPAGR